MKRLKFMLAAATAIGLSSASHAYVGSTNFEAFNDGDAVDSSLNQYFEFNGAEGDNESVISAEGASYSAACGRPYEFASSGQSTNILKVSTGTDPLLRKIKGAAENVATAGPVYIDTLVQFTVTPATDTVETNSADKLLIYLKEDVVNGTTVTNLMVKAADYTPANEGLLQPEAIVPTDVAVSSTVVPGQWYRLTVKAFVVNNGRDADGLLAFNIKLDGILLSSPVVLLRDGAGDQTAFPSLLGMPADAQDTTKTSIAAVGFAGEGKVDDLSFMNVDPFDPNLDFTLAWPSGLSAVSYTIGQTTTTLEGLSSPLTIKAPSGATVYFNVSNGDVVKTLSAVAGTDEGQATELDATGTTFEWADYLGEAVDGAYVINDAAELLLFKKGVAKFGTSGLTFKLGDNIDATDLGYFDGIGTASGTNGSSGLNNCTFDGAGKTISNVSFSNAKYRGFFNQVLNSTIKDLTINVVDIAQHSDPSAEHGYSAFAGNMKNSKIQNCVATGTLGTTAKPTMHTCGGFAVKSDGGNVFENCTNYVDIVCSLPDNPKIGGIVGLAQTGSIAITNCWNYGDITITLTKCENAGNGAGGLVGYAASALTIHGGGNAGTIQATDTTTPTGNIAIKVGTIIAMQNSSTATITGGTVAQADQAPAGAFANVSGLDFATVDGNVATFVDTLAAGNTYKVMNAAATATCELAAEGSTIAFDTALATPTYAITSAAGLAAPKSATVDGVTTYWVPSYAAANPWYENPAAVVLAEDLPGQTGNIVSAFHGQGEGEYLGLTYSTNPQQFDLFTVDGTNTPTTVITLSSGDASLNMPGFRGVAISKTLGVAMTLAYYAASNMYVFPLTGGAATVVSKPSAYSFDAGAFSPDGKYFFSNALNGESSNQFYVKWAVSDGGATLTKVGSISAGGRGRNLAYARINGRDLVFAMIDTGKVAVIDMTGDDSSAWSATDLITGLPAHSYGTLCVSGVNTVDAEGNDATPHLTVATSTNNGATKIDVLNVYALTVPASGAVTASLTKSFDEDALTAAGFGDISDANRYGNTVYVTDDEKTIYFARPDNKLYAAQYAAPAPSGEELEPGEQSQTTYDSLAAAEAAAANVTIVAADDIATNETITAQAKTDYLDMFEAKVIALTMDPVTYMVKVDLTAAAEAALQTQADADAAEVIEDLSESTVTLTTTPGFYYSFEYGTTLDNMSEVGPRTLATGTSLTLDRPTTSGATAGFYRVLVNVKAD